MLSTSHALCFLAGHFRCLGTYPLFYGGLFQDRAGKLKIQSITPSLPWVSRISYKAMIHENSFVTWWIIFAERVDWLSGDQGFVPKSACDLVSILSPCQQVTFYLSLSVTFVYFSFFSWVKSSHAISSLMGLCCGSWKLLCCFLFSNEKWTWEHNLMYLPLKYRKAS